jgi:outer membrane receptor protein involved in Fe transport
LFYSKLTDGFYNQDSDIPHPAGGWYMMAMNSDQINYGAELTMEYRLEGLGLTPYVSMTAMRYVRKYNNGYKTDNTGVPKTWGVGGLRWESHVTETVRLYADASLAWSGGFHNEGPERVSD